MDDFFEKKFTKNKFKLKVHTFVYFSVSHGKCNPFSISGKWLVFDVEMGQMF
jgi:hypothetical protein